MERRGCTRGRCAWLRKEGGQGVLQVLDPESRRGREGRPVVRGVSRAHWRRCLLCKRN